jgi:drug/metabolite transporter (DMT)-like permease
MVLPPTSHSTRSAEHRAVLMLLVACVLWGMSFNWNKDGQALLGQRLVEASGEASLNDLAPVLLLLIRFVIAIGLWVIVFPNSVRGWTSGTLKGGAAGGVLLSGGILLQHYGLAHTSESLSSFLTSLTILFTPIFASALLRQRIGGVLWASVACATVGVGLMTIYRAEGHFDRGALLGLLCAVVFSGHILVVDRVGKRENTLRFTLAQLMTACIVFSGFCLIWSRPEGMPRMRDFGPAFRDGRFLTLLALSTVFSTLITFGIMFRYQPRTTATRAALIYLTEPLFATAYAWLMVGRAVENAALLGGALIIAGNVLAEAYGRRSDSRDAPVTVAATGSDK